LVEEVLKAEVRAGELEGAPSAVTQADGAGLRREGYRLWSVLRRMRNAGPVKHAMDRMSHLPPYVAAKRIVSSTLLGRH